MGWRSCSFRCGGSEKRNRIPAFQILRDTYDEIHKAHSVHCVDHGSLDERFRAAPGDKGANHGRGADDRAGSDDQVPRGWL